LPAAQAQQLSEAAVELMQAWWEEGWWHQNA
jgi:hypothetical protein